jgi:PEP-CTERM motif
MKKMQLAIPASILFLAVRAVAQSSSVPPAVPEPGTGWLIGVGLFAIGYSTWRRKRKGE